MRRSAVSAVLVVGFVLLSFPERGDAGVLVIRNRIAWLNALETGVPDTSVDFEGFTSRIEFGGVPVDVGPFTASREGSFSHSQVILPAGQSQAVLPSDDFSTAFLRSVNGNTFTPASTVLTYDAPFSGWGTDYRGSNDQNPAGIELVFETLLGTQIVPFPEESGFIGFVATEFDQITVVKIRGRLPFQAGQTAFEAYGLDNIVSGIAEAGSNIPVTVTPVSSEMNWAVFAALEDNDVPVVTPDVETDSSTAGPPLTNRSVSVNAHVTFLDPVCCDRGEVEVRGDATTTFVDANNGSLFVHSEFAAGSNGVAYLGGFGRDGPHESFSFPSLLVYEFEVDRIAKIRVDASVDAPGNTSEMPIYDVILNGNGIAGSFFVNGNQDGFSSTNATFEPGLVRMFIRAEGGTSSGFRHFGGVTQNPPFDIAETLLTWSVVGAEDADGIDDATEQSAPNGGDGNNDGIPDAEQRNVASLPAGAGSGFVTAAVEFGCSEIVNVNAYAEGQVGPLDPAFEYPVGLVDFQIPCSFATLKLIFHGTDSLVPPYRKYGPTVPGDLSTADWYDFPGAVFSTEVIAGVSTSVVTLTLVDGQLGDDTGVDGVIVDIGGPSTPLTCEMGPDTDSDGICDLVDNCTLAPNVAQIDTDQDGFGNACDSDFNNDGSIGFADFSVFASKFGLREGDVGYDAQCDSDDNDVVGLSDFNALRKTYGGVPGPSGLPCAGTVPCP